MMVGIWGAGLIGRSLAAVLAGQGVPVCILNRSTEKPVLAAGRELPMRCLSFAAGAGEMLAVLQGLSVLVHCAGSAGDDHAEFEAATLVLAEAAIKAGLRRVVMLSTVAVYGDALEAVGLTPGTCVVKSLPPMPVSRYAQSRYRAESCMRECLRQGGVGFTVVRVPMVLGPGMTARPFAKLRQALDIGIFPALGSPSACLPCIRCERLAHGLAMLVMEAGPLQDLYQFSESLPWSSVRDSYVEKTGKRVLSIPLPGRFIFNLLNLLGARRAALIVKSMTNEAVYLDDLAGLLGEDGSGQPSKSRLCPDDALRDTLWP